MISKQEVKHIAELARIELNAQEIEKFGKDLSAILDYFKILEQPDVSKIKPTFHPNEDSLGVMREDKAEPETSETINKIVETAPNKDKRHIKVKAVF